MSEKEKNDNGDDYDNDFFYNVAQDENSIESDENFSFYFLGYFIARHYNLWAFASDT